MAIVTDKQFREWEQAVFGYGYGTGEAFILPVLHAFLTETPLPSGAGITAMEGRFGGAAVWLLLNALCHADILSYGTSPRYSWLTEKGERLRAYLLRTTPRRLYDMVTQEMSPEDPLCSPVFCNCPGAVEGQGCQNNPLFAPAFTRVRGTR